MFPFCGHDMTSIFSKSKSIMVNIMLHAFCRYDIIVIQRKVEHTYGKEKTIYRRTGPDT